MKNIRIALVLAGTFMVGAASAQLRPVPGAPPSTFVSVFFRSGSVFDVDAAKKQIQYYVYLPGNENPTRNEFVTVPDTTVITVQKHIKPADLRVGDTVAVRGVPLVMSASRLNAGDTPDDLGDPQSASQLNGMFYPFGGFGMNFQDSRSRDGIDKLHPSFAEAVGRVVHLKPLTVSVAAGVRIVLKLASDADITKMAAAQFSDVKPGDRILMVSDEQETRPGEMRNTLRRLEILQPVQTRSVPARVEVLQPRQNPK